MTRNVRWFVVFSLCVLVVGAVAWLIMSSGSDQDMSVGIAPEEQLATSTIPSRISAEPSSLVREALSAEELQDWRDQREELRVLSKTFEFPALSQEVLTIRGASDLLADVAVGGTIRKARSGELRLCLPGGPERAEPYNCNDLSAVRLSSGGPDLSRMEDKDVVARGQLVQADRDAVSTFPWTLVVSSLEPSEGAKPSTGCTYTADPSASDAPRKFAISDTDVDTATLQEAFTLELYAQMPRDDTSFSFLSLSLDSARSHAFVVAASADQASAQGLAELLGLPVEVSTIGHAGSSC